MAARSEDAAAEFQKILDAEAALDMLVQRVLVVYLHIDMDSLDPKMAPRVIRIPVGGGILLEDMEETIRGVFDRFRVGLPPWRSTILTATNTNKALRTALRLIKVSADGARAQDHGGRAGLPMRKGG
jgi:hypothetical protein